jgi:uncharacterized membrane protein YdbT with pleckstrin-like domain
MSFLDSSLSTGEEIVGRYPLHWVNYLPIVRLALIGVIVALVMNSGILNTFLEKLPRQGLDIGILVLYAYLAIRMVFVWLHLRFTELAATNKRVLCKTGIWARSTSEMKISSIETVTMRQGIIGRVLNYGSLLVTGKGVSDVLFHSIANPLDVKRDIESINSGSTRDGSDA